MLCKIFGGVTTGSESNIYKISYSIFMVMNILGYIHSVWGKLQLPYNIIIQINDHILSFLLFISCIAVIASNVFISPGRLQKITKQLEDMDSRTTIRYNIKKRFFWICLLTHLSMIALNLIVDYYAWLNILNNQLYKYYIVRHLEYCSLHVIFFVYVWIAIEITFRYKNVNYMLINVFNSTQIINKNKQIMKKPNIVIQVKIVSKLHYQLCEIVEEYNGVFGIFALFLVLFNIAFFLSYSVELIYFGLMSGTVGDQSFGVSVLVADCLWLISAFVSIL